MAPEELYCLPLKDSNDKDDAHSTCTHRYTNLDTPRLKSETRIALMAQLLPPVA